MKVGIVNAATHGAPVMLEVFPSADIGTLKSMIEVELRIPYVRQSLSVPGKYSENLIRDQDTIQSLGLAEGEIVLVTDKGAQGNSPMQPVATELFERSSKERGYMAKLKQYQPELAAAVEKKDIKAATAALTNLFSRKKHGTQQGQEAVYSFKDPVSSRTGGQPGPVAFIQPVPCYLVQPYHYDPYVQPVNPAFSEVQKSLLFVGVTTNGIPSKALIDCAAQVSTVSESYARHCNLLGALDTRYHGHTGGPDSALTIGRLHHVDVSFPPHNAFGCSLSVVQSCAASDLVLGLDFFKRYQCCIDLRYNCLRIGDSVAIPFLTPQEIQTSLNDDILKSLLHQQPTEFGGSVMQQSARSSAYNFTMDSAPPNYARQQQALPPPGRRDNKHQQPSPNAGHGQHHPDAHTPVAATHQTRLSPPLGASPPHIPPQTNTHHDARRSETLELNVNRSRRIHQQVFDDKNAGGKIIEETKIKQLTELGFDQVQAQHALRKCKGDTELAAALLFQSTARI